MALFNKPAQQTSDVAPTTVSASTSDGSIFEDVAGEGISEELQEAGKNSISYVSITQSTSKLVQTGAVPLGHWYSGGLKQDFGTTLSVVPIGFKIGWTERDAQGQTVARYTPGSVEVVGDNYSGMKNPKSGNKIEETWIYLFVMPDHMDLGPFIYTAGAGALKYLKRWNNKLRSMRLPSGKVAPIYAKAWQITLTQVTSKRTGTLYSAPTEFDELGWVDKNLFDAILPVKDNAVALIAGPAPEEGTEGETY